MGGLWRHRTKSHRKRRGNLEDVLRDKGSKGRGRQARKEREESGEKRRKTHPVEPILPDPAVVYLINFTTDWKAPW
jgi:hypothetical protein